MYQPRDGVWCVVGCSSGDGGFREVVGGLGYRVDESIVAVSMIVFGMLVRGVMSIIYLAARTTIIDYPYPWI
jgi:hypothetical protein